VVVMDFMEFLKLANEETNRIIFDYLPKGDGVEELDLLYRMMRDYPSRPKKGLRAALCLLSAKALSGDYRRALVTASAIELFQSWVLIHDDIEDESELRRGSPTLHRLYNVPLALNAGDALHSKMWGLLLRNKDILGCEMAVRILEEFSKMVDRTAEGQHIELGWIAKDRWDLSEEDYFRMVSLKSAYYTCTAPMRMGSMIGGMDSERLDRIDEMGRPLGIAFQIQDDVLNLIGGKKYGKEGKDDILEGKRTLILIRLLEVAKERDRIIELVSKPRRSKTREDVEYVFRKMVEYGAIDYARRVARRLYEEAIEKFDMVFEDVKDEEARECLRDLFRYLIERSW